MAKKKSLDTVKTVRTPWGVRPVQIVGYYPEQGRFRGYYGRDGGFYSDLPFLRWRTYENEAEIVAHFVNAA